jgi:hypothetical protein
MMRRMADAAPGGTLVMAGHRPIDPATRAATTASNQVQVSVEAALATLGSGEWEIAIAEDGHAALPGRASMR